jgi:O-antigen/teichoic acid export membrane protein
VQRPQLTPQAISSALCINVSLGMGLAIGVFFLAAPIAALAAKPDLADVLMVMAWLTIPQSVMSIYVALLRRALDFRGLALRAVFAILVSSLVAIAMAIQGAGLWALVGMQVVNVIVSVAVVMYAAGRLSLGRPDLATAREMMSAALPLMAAGIVGTLAWTLPTLAFGLALPAAVVGYFFIAQRVMMSLNGVCTASVGDLSLSVLARLQSSTDRHRAAARQALRLGGLVCLPAFAGVGMVAEPLLLSLFGPQWTQSIVPLQLLMLSSVAVAATFIAGQVVLSFGHHRLVLLLNLLALLPPALTSCALAPLGLVPALAGSAIASLFSLVVVGSVLCRTLGLRPRALLGDQLPSLMAVAVMILTLTVWPLVTFELATVLDLIARIALGGAVFAGVLAWRDPELCRLVLSSMAGARRDCAEQAS